jgi:hypothetical protein
VKQPKTLTLKQAIAVTNNPLIRLYDLISVQKDERLGDLYADTTDLNEKPFSKGVMRSAFAPSLGGNPKDFVKHFPQPETENHLHDLYNNGGWIESIAHFYDEELALYYYFRAGVSDGTIFASNAGDPSYFERDMHDALKMLPNVTPEIVTAVRKTIVSQQKKYKLAANQGQANSRVQSDKARKKRSPKNESHETLETVFARLARNNQGTKPSELWPHYKTAIAEWSGCDCNELTPGDDKDKWFYEYQDGDEKVKTITYGKFRKDLAQLRR